MKFRILIALIFPLIGFSQFEFQYGGVVGLSNSTTFNEFRDHYNSVNQSGLAKPMDKGLVNYGTNFQIGFNIGNFYSGIGYCSVINKPQTEFLNGAGRVIILNSKYLNILMGYSDEISDDSEFAVYSGFVVNDYIMSSYIRYKNNDKDYTAGSMSGVFQTQGFGIPLIGHYSRRIIGNFWLYGKCQLQVISATKFGVYDYLSLSKQIKDDAKRCLFEVGIQFKFI